MAMQYPLAHTNLGISAGAVSHHAFMFPQPPPPPIMVTRIWRRVQNPHQPPLWRLVQYPYGIHHVIMTPPLFAAYHDQYPPRPSGQHDQHGINNMSNNADQETNSNNLDGDDIITTNTSSDDHIHDDDDSAADCAVCLDEFYGDVGVLINCGHKFHVGCINEWLKEKNSCPLCRALVYVHANS